MTGEPIGAPLRGHTNWVSSVAFGAIDGRPIVASGSSDESIRLWDARTGEPLGVPFEGHTDWVNSVAFGSIDGRPMVASGSDDGTIRLWGAMTGENGHSSAITIGEPIQAVNTDSGAIVIGLARGIVLLKLFATPQK
jgi:WD40 repeat protein